mgnify:CR=1 FL=1|jgi:DNA-binding LytR/AlgR family response regulator
MRVLIVEDEIMAQRSLARQITQNFPDLTIIGSTSSVTETVNWFKDPSNSVDIIFMDVELADGDCFEIFRQIDISAKVIMTTAYDNYAIKAFEAGSIDYLLKPIDISALKRAVSRCVTKEDNTNLQALINFISSSEKKKYKERFILKINDRILPVETKDIAYFYSEDKTNYLMTFDKKKYILDLSLDEISSEIDPKNFFKTSRQCIISMKAIKSIIRLAGGRLRIETTPESSFEINVSRSRVDDFLLWIEN